MIEVFKTNITNKDQALIVKKTIHGILPDCIVNFDLEDCDNILRVEHKGGLIDSALLVDFLQSFGCTAEVLPDEANLFAE